MSPASTTTSASTAAGGRPPRSRCRSLSTCRRNARAMSPGRSLGMPVGGDLQLTRRLEDDGPAVTRGVYDAELPHPRPVDRARVLQLMPDDRSQRVEHRLGVMLALHGPGGV